MNSRSRVLKTLAHEEPDRVPFNLRPSPEMVARLRKEQHNSTIDFADFFRHDIRYVCMALPECPRALPNRTGFPASTPTR